MENLGRIIIWLFLFGVVLIAFEILKSVVTKHLERNLALLENIRLFLLTHKTKLRSLNGELVETSEQIQELISYIVTNDIEIVYDENNDSLVYFNNLNAETGPVYLEGGVSVAASMILSIYPKDFEGVPCIRITIGTSNVTAKRSHVAVGPEPT